MSRRDSIVLFFVASALAHAQSASEKIEFLEARIRPVLANNCLLLPHGQQTWRSAGRFPSGVAGGGGVRSGNVPWRPDETFCFKVAQNPVHVHDLHATALHLLGMDHEKLTYALRGPGFPVDGC